MKNLRFGMIGCGKLARKHAESVQKIEGAAFVAYADIHQASADTFLKDFGGEYAVCDPMRLIADKSIDAVYICTLHDSHAPLAIAAAHAGKHIMLEKPLALKMEDCQAVADAVARSGIYLMPAFKMRYYPLIQQAHEFIPRPQVLVGQCMDNRWADDNWAQDPVKGGANVHSQGCHVTDILRYFAGSEPKRIWAAGGTMTHPGHPCIDQCTAAIQFADGRVASWIQGDAACGSFTSKFFFELFGDGRSVQIFDRMKKATFFDGKESWTLQRDDEEGIQLENAEFIAALRQGRAPELTVQDGIQATRIVLAADRAIRSGQVQEL